jgi:hypothetical protein
MLTPSQAKDAHAAARKAGKSLPAFIIAMMKESGIIE